MSSSITVISKMTAKPGRRTDVEACLRTFYDSVRSQEPGCITNIMHAPMRAPNDLAAETGGQTDRLVFYEVYRDAEAGKFHTQTPHFKVLMSQLESLIDGKIELEFLRELDRK